MKILILSNSDSGLYQFRKELIERLTIDNEVMCSVPNADGFLEKLEKLGCKCINTEFERRSKNPFKDLKLLRTYRKLIRQYNPDAVLTYTIKPNVYGGIACRMEKKPYLANITGLGTAIENGGLLGRLSLALYRIGLKKAECVFFQNENNKLFFEKMGITGKYMRLIPGSGVNIKTHSLEPYPADDEVFRFLFVGRVMKDKGIGELLEAVVAVKAQNKCIFLDVVGGCDEAYQDLLEEYENKGFLKYHGKQEDVHPFYKNAHCVVLPTYHEGMANVLLEASSVGRPVIATRVPGCREIFDEELTGFGCEAGDAQSLVTAMKRMSDLSWNERRTMGLSAHDKVAREFDRNIVVNAYIEQLNVISH